MTTAQIATSTIDDAVDALSNVVDPMRVHWQSLGRVHYCSLHQHARDEEKEARQRTGRTVRAMVVSLASKGRGLVRRDHDARALYEALPPIDDVWGIAVSLTEARYAAVAAYHQQKTP